jgi:hypothetical protein
MEQMAREIDALRRRLDEHETEFSAEVEEAEEPSEDELLEAWAEQEAEAAAERRQERGW